MTENLYKFDETVELLGKVGRVIFNEENDVLAVEPFVEEHTEYYIDECVEDDTPLDEIPPHLKQVIPLFFYNRDALYPENSMVCCISPGKLQKFVSKAWVDIPYIDNWKKYESIVEQSQQINYPFIVTTYSNICPRTIKLLDKRKMGLFKSILNVPNRQISIQEFEAKWIHLFNSQNIHNIKEGGAPFAAWLEVAQSPSAYVDVLQYHSESAATVVFTIPPLMSFNDSMSSVMKENTTTNYLNMAKRAEEQSNRIPKSGNEEIQKGLTSNMAASTTSTKHTEMWKAIEERYNMYIITSPDDNLSNNDKVEKVSNEQAGYEDEMLDI